MSKLLEKVKKEVLDLETNLVEVSAVSIKIEYNFNRAPKNLFEVKLKCWCKSNHPATARFNRVFLFDYETLDLTKTI